MKIALLTTLTLFAANVTSCSHIPETDHGSNADKNIATKLPHKAHTLFQNEYVRVKRMDLDPGETLPEHSGRARIVYSLTDYDLEWSENGKSANRKSWKQGDIHAHGFDSHAAKNVGKTKASFVIFERLAKDMTTHIDHTATHAHKQQVGSKVLLNNANYKVVEIELSPRERQEVHDGGRRVIYSLTDYQLEWFENGKTVQTLWKSGDVHWHGQVQHSAKNSGKTKANWLVVTLKK